MREGARARSLARKSNRLRLMLLPHDVPLPNIVVDPESLDRELGYFRASPRLPGFARVSLSH